MEFALSRGCGRKPRELMTPSKHEGAFYVGLYFGNARPRTWDWSGDSGCPDSLLNAAVSFSLSAPLS
jgi:hypothetical protein